jgi:NurA-like 5'-3' nuclease
MLEFGQIALFGSLTMTDDYYSLLVRALRELESNTVMTRRVLYGTVREALVKQARAMEPAMREADVTKERLKLERAIRKVEMEELESNGSKKALIGLARHIEILLANLAVQ